MIQKPRTIADILDTRTDEEAEIVDAAVSKVWAAGLEPDDWEGDAAEALVRAALAGVVTLDGLLDAVGVALAPTVGALAGGTLRFL